MIGGRACLSAASVPLVLLVGACQTQTPEVPALGWEMYGRSLERFRGQTVRVCGRLTRIGEHWAVEHAPHADQSFRHGNPAVLVVPCGTGEPRLDREGCLAGRIAAENGSLDPPPQQVRDNSPVSPDWFLHAQCRSAE